MTLAGIRARLRRLLAPPGIKRMIALGELLTGAWAAQGISTVARLGVADLIGDQLVGIEELARSAGANEDALYRVLRMLVPAGVFLEFPGRRFALRPLGELLRSDHACSMRAFAMYNGEPWHWQMWGDLERCVRTGAPAAAGGENLPLFEFLARHPGAEATFDAAMADLSNARDVSAISGYDFARFRTVVDVGGGEGRLVRSVLKAFPTLSGILYDLPPVIERARERIAADGLAERCRLVKGNFFESVPADGDAYMLKQVLHDWQDDKASVILGNCRRALTAGGAVLIFEMVVPEDASPAIGKLSDIEMLVATGGRERTLKEYQSLLERSGLCVRRTYETRSPFSIIEAQAL